MHSMKKKDMQLWIVLLCFHIKANTPKHVELQIVAKTLMDQPQEQEPKIPIL
jgi:hypothetical protein